VGDVTVTKWIEVVANRSTDGGWFAEVETPMQFEIELLDVYARSS
jgi:hypothetical protein